MNLRIREHINFFRIASWILCVGLLTADFFHRFPHAADRSGFLQYCFTFVGLALLLWCALRELGFRARNLLLQTSFDKADVALGFGIFAWLLCFYLKLTLNPFAPLLILAALFFLFCFRTYRDRDRIRAWATQWDSPFILCLVCLAVTRLLTVSNGVGLLQFPVDFDSGLFHVAFPIHVVQAGHYFNPDWLRVPWHPQLMHDWYIFLLRISSLMYLKVVNLLVILQLITLFICSPRALGRLFGITLFLLLSILPEFQRNIVSTSLDTGLALFIVTAFAILIYFLRNRNWRDLLFCSVLMGFAGGMKHFGLMFSAACLGSGGLYYLLAAKDPRIQRRILQLGVCIVVFLCAWVPFYFHNISAGTSLLFPFFGTHTNPYGWNLDDLNRLTEFTIPHFGFRHNLFGFFQLPVHWVWHPESYEFIKSDSWADWAYSVEFVCLLLTAVVTLTFKKARKPHYWLPVVVLVSYFALWYRASQVLRYLFPMLISGFYYFAALGSDHLKDFRPRYQIPAVSALLFLGLSFIAPFGYTVQYKIPITPPQREAWWQSNVSDNIPAFQWLRSHNPPNTRILSFATPQVAPLFPELRLCGDWFGWFRYANYLKDYRLFDEWNLVSADFKKYRFKYVIVDWRFIRLFKRPLNDQWEDFFTASTMKCLRHVYFDGRSTDIFEVNTSCL